MPDVTKEQVKEISSMMESIVGKEGPAFDLSDSILGLLAMPEEQFTVLAPGVVQSFQQTLNNPGDKVGLVQALNASGHKAEELLETFSLIEDKIDKSSLPRIKRDFLKELLSSLYNAINDTEGIAKRILIIPIELCHDEAKIPQYAHITDSGLDVYALEDITVHPGETVLVPTGIKVALPVGFEFQVRPKSGRALKTKLRVANTPGTIDQGYRDEIKIIIENVDPPIKDITIDAEGKVTSILYGSDYTIGKGEKFCQLVLAEVPKVSFYRVESVAEIGENRGGGFGSSSIYDKNDDRYGTDLL